MGMGKGKGAAAAAADDDDYDDGNPSSRILAGLHSSHTAPRTQKTASAVKTLRPGFEITVRAQRCWKPA